MMEFKIVGIAGAAQMRGGIAQAAASRGLRVILYDSDDDSLLRTFDRVRKSLQKSAAKEDALSLNIEAILERIHPAADIKDLGPAEFIIEAAPEREEIKCRIFETLDAVCPTKTTLATNTSSISISRIASCTRHPERVIGMHFMNPVPVMKLIEVVRGMRTSDETVHSTYQLAEQLGKTPVDAKDLPGFITNRILMPMINEAIFALQDGVGSAKDIDTSMRLGMRHPMGPLELADFIGLDTCLFVLETLQDGFKDSKYRPCPLLRRYVDAGRLGRKSGEGFYRYRSGRKGS